MRCLSCNRILSSFESTRKYTKSHEYVDLCKRCIKDLGITTVDREDLRDESDLQEMWAIENECERSEELYENGLSFEGEIETPPHSE